MPAGYSGTPLVKKLGIKEGARVAFVDAPASFAATLGPLPAGVATADGRGAVDLAVLFVRERGALEAALPKMLRRLDTAGALWVGWPKRASKVPTDLTEDVVRAVAIANGVVDVKVCAIDETWSGLKLVRRLKDRR
ncbi:MAG TPA: DUF3052 family protein [Gemmatimonadaceae bacterium]|nr:DUF3052 family protein [Gemmatimonadaceae bacterium]